MDSSQSENSLEEIDQISQTIEIIHPEFDRVDLDGAYAFRIELDDSPDVAEKQLSLINSFRLDDQVDNQMVAIQEGARTVLGFFDSPEQFAKFKKIASQYEGSYGLGASFGDSQITLSKDPITGEIDYIVTCEATNGAARDQKSKLARRTEALSQSGVQVTAHRYYIEADEATTQKLLQEGKIVTGAKGTYLEKVPPTFTPRSERAPLLPAKLTEKLQPTAEKEEILHDITHLSVLTVDINGFSRIVHEKTINLIKAQIADQSTPEEIATLQLEINNYIQKIATFFTTLEHTTQKLVTEKDPTQQVNVIERRGDADGLLVPTAQKEVLLQALGQTLKAFPEFSIKAALKDYADLTITRQANQKINSPLEVDLTDENVGDLIKTYGLDKDKSKTIIAEQDEAGQTVLKVYYTNVQGELLLLEKHP